VSRLSTQTLAHLPPAIRQPSYDRSKVKVGIVHLGIGAFHRSHQAVYTEDCLERGDLRWGILGASLRSPETRDTLTPQDGLFTVASRSNERTDFRVVGSVVKIVVAPENPQALIEAMAHPDVKIVSLTVTEKGYCIDPLTGLLNEAHPDIVHDLANAAHPRSAPGFIVAALKLRRERGTAPFTALSCDNLPANGEKLRAIIIRLATLFDPVLGSYVEQHVAFPSTMVDRIVPQTTEEDRALVAQALGGEDAWPIVTEPFTQWVIEDHFPGGRPDWGAVGAELVKDVAPYEAMKLRLLNGAHSMLAYLGSLAGHITVAEAMADSTLSSFVEDFMVEDVTPTLSIPEGPNVGAYCQALLERFRNTSLKHRLVQIASDSSQKIPQRFLGTARDRLAMGLPLGRLADGIAGFIHFAGGRDKDGQWFEWKDPLADEIRQRLRVAGPQPEAAIDAVLGVGKVFGTELPNNPHFRLPILEAYRRRTR
jgi:fructuronate reductase